MLDVQQILSDIDWLCHILEIVSNGRVKSLVELNWLGQDPAKLHLVSYLREMIQIG